MLFEYQARQVIIHWKNNLMLLKLEGRKCESARELTGKAFCHDGISQPARS